MQTYDEFNKDTIDIDFELEHDMFEEYAKKRLSSSNNKTIRNIIITQYIFAIE